MLNVYGSLFYAGARTLEESLPRVGKARSPVVIIRLRGRSMMGSTAFSVLSRYAGRLDEADGRLYLSGVAPELLDQFQESGRIQTSAPMGLFEATPRLGESTRAALEEAEAFLIGEAEGVSWDEFEKDPLVSRAALRVRGWLGSKGEP